MARRAGTVWSKTYDGTPLRDKAGIRFAPTLIHLLQQGHADYRRDGRRGVFSPALVQLCDFYQGRHEKGSVVKFWQPGHFTDLPTIEVAAPEGRRTYVAEYTRRMDSNHREKMLGSPLVNRFVKRFHVKDMSQLVGEGVFELQLPVDLSNEGLTRDVFNSLGIYHDTDYTRPWEISAY